VPVHNRAGTLEKCLSAIRQSDFKDYELLVIDDASTDQTASIAAKFADKVISCQRHLGLAGVLLKGLQSSSGQIIVNIDSDVVIKETHLSYIVNFLSQNPRIDAFTGILSKDNPHKNFLSQYKNLYMHYIYQLQPREVTFLYGSIFGLRKEIIGLWGNTVKFWAVDTEFGQRIALSGKKIALLKELEVRHFKKHNIRTFLINDFMMPFSWAHLFFHYKGWLQLGRRNTGFAHAGKSLLASVVLAPAVLGLFIARFLIAVPESLFWAFAILWMGLNLRFLIFLFLNKGVIFGLLAVPTVFLDNLAMASGILCGTIAEAIFSLTAKTAETKME
jgi:glycosyltransferase involved in cell wall biosynthesis